jgi:D-sedoheptulose 7-phosphate isomerase
MTSYEPASGTFAEQLEAAITLLQACRDLAPAIDDLVNLIADRVLLGHTLFTCGNGGSATDAMHLAEELIGRYHADRRPLPAVCLNADVGALTCITNDYGYDQVFARQVEALARPNDILVVFSTSGGSPNILAALQAARARRATSVAFLGKGGGAARELADYAVIVPSSNTARIQEVHTLLLHAVCEELDGRLTGPGPR